ncbi:IclR family transcriptional regulator [Roseicitreum antarcticum]|uniref:Transcriptional regulator, IclR family n=1 Tax=Roseicitreum antarcticum TaxID=564137 RepID=A0A1H2W3F8_9RHOB|nr:IclR family transcriptional regulator [Roseicitreum antarcticum]SDW74629.1 transcriptional regulator, IclR family [Roseicitreum antarcticum]
MQSHDKLLGVLDLFDENRPEWGFDDIHERLGYSRSTLYRYLKVLLDAGLLSSFPGRGYTLGPRIIELDYQIMANDPLIHAARPVMHELVASYSCVSLLCRRYRQKVLCVHQEVSTTKVRSNYERGRSRPLLRGAASQVILAYLSSYQLTKLYEEDQDGFADAGLGNTLAAVRKSLRVIRQRGWYHTQGQVTPGVTGVAAPIFDANDEITGSISLTFPEPALSQEKLDSVGERIEFSARVISNTLR